MAILRVLIVPAAISQLRERLLADLRAAVETIRPPVVAEGLTNIVDAVAATRNRRQEDGRDDGPQAQSSLHLVPAAPNTAAMLSWQQGQGEALQALMASQPEEDERQDRDRRDGAIGCAASSS